ncbi:MAG TPA: hypothetical protein P5080_06045 [Candidatus Paceibacterota bacterium]|nr:hypothetical protein [Candidatus Pacearchaeota archaeon]HRZ51517.1 hypothetical protein [Candidatus Paceibacterota bacterium]HSA37228.1 hypothetical protein [Candidatus Paceibacterota bacterium]
MVLREFVEKVIDMPNAGRKGVNLDDQKHRELDAAGYHYLANDLLGRRLEDISELEDRGLRSYHELLEELKDIEYQTAPAYDIENRRIKDNVGIASFWVRRKGGK